MFCIYLDTGICLAFLKSNGSVVEEVDKKLEECYLSTIVLADLYQHNSEHSKRQQEILSEQVQDHIDVR